MRLREKISGRDGARVIGLNQKGKEIGFPPENTHFITIAFPTSR